VKKVVLFSSGVGFFQHSGVISGNSAIRLPFSKNQINDVLKLLVVENLDGGKPGFVLYPTRDPQSKILANFQIDLRNDPSLANILKQLRGSQILSKYQDEIITGTLLNIEKRPLNLPGSKKPVSDWMLTLNSKTGLRTLPLRDIIPITGKNYPNMMLF